MKVFSKKIYILVSISIIAIICFIGMYNYKKPIAIHKTFNEAIVTKPSGKEVLKKTTIEIDANLYRGLYTGSIFNFNAHFRDKLEGKIIIDNKEYYFHGFTEKSELINIFGSVYENSQGTSEVFGLEMNDLNSILLLGVGDNWHDYEIEAQSE
ncbi:hypothetical protein [Clostridium sp. BL-8]|uniref:hypothetical protein n=1 Tax=Clostridium sp. BL-8 TaxID=349938 RepID=UPI00098CCBD6|nr:hypothetical protein [Clostridium sp. BL-8]OOM77599.1 hypothetical protein CLOBL_28560 [Clostridium sp. BL-8]